ncbi:hypothetical protein B0O99DRAFT_98767 [Bisporella sp. PMI_857]|nr:hypothetical protein B0O99DRAFT_98767 [Bisporella sp. PMI_857]
MRRHERPYGCTYPLCTKSFGSKFDWRRHEQYQHAEPWKDQPDQLTTSGDVRDIPSTDSPNENSRQRWHHQLDSRDSDTAQDETGRGLAGGSTGSRAFWCGFCDGFVPVAIELARAWTERSDHITNHFIRDEKRIEEWIVAN